MRVKLVRRKWPNFALHLRLQSIRSIATPLRCRETALRELQSAVSKCYANRFASATRIKVPRRVNNMVQLSHEQDAHIGFVRQCIQYGLMYV
jgi:hypothetical protein